MEELLKNIELVLSNEIETHISMIRYAYECNSAIKEGKIDEVNRARQQHDELLCSLEHLEEKRIAYCDELASLMEIHKRPVKLSKLLENVSEQWKKRLLQKQTDLKEKIVELSKVTISNRILIHEGLKIIKGTFDCIRKTNTKYSGYAHDGTSAVSTILSIVNRTV